MAVDRVAVQQVLDRMNRHGHQRPSEAMLARLETRLSASAASRALRRENLPQLSYPGGLPITAHKEEIAAAIREHAVVIVAGDTGSGKSTQIPKICLDAGRGIDGMIGHTQPRRIAAVSVAQRIAEELGHPLGESVGYKIRFRDRTARNTYIKVMTDGILLAETQADRLLTAYDTIIVDEAHERSLNIDFILGYLKGLLGRRPDLKVVVTSATIDTEKFSRAFDDAPVIEVSGRMYPVEVRYEPAQRNGGEADLTHVELAVRAVGLLLRERRGGDILVFMPTEQDVRETCEMIDAGVAPGTLVMPLFARLTAAEQRRVFHAGSGRKIVVATNVAETSITIPGITYVVDTGLARIPRYSPRTRTTAMPVAPIARSSADQRKGRCGRVADGVCIRLFSEEDYLGRPLYTPPEILRANLAEVILRMIALGLGDVSRFPFIDPPDAKSIRDGLRLLYELGAIETNGKGRAPEGKRRPGAEGGAHAVRLTDIGRMMARIPLDPRLARILIQAREEGCEEAIAVIAAALSIQDPRERPAEKTAEADRIHAAFNEPASDFLTLLRIWNRFQEARKELKSHSRVKQFCRDHFLSYPRMREWADVCEQIIDIMKELGWRRNRPASGEPDFGKIHRSILAGFLSNIAFKKEKNIYRATQGREAMIFPGSGLFNAAGAWIVAAEMVETTRLYARTVATIDAGWLEKAAGGLCRSSFADPRWDAKRGEVVASEQVSLFGLPIVAARLASYGKVNAQEAAEIFIHQALIAGELGQSMAFLHHNQALAAKVQRLEDRIRRRDVMVGEDDLAAFYRKRLTGVYDIRSLRQMIRRKRGDAFLRMQEEDLLRYQPQAGELALYPEHFHAGGYKLDLGYRFEPGADVDGATLRVPSTIAAAVSPADLDWIVPGLLREKVEVLLKGLPKALRTRLMPLKETAEIVIQEMPKEHRPLPAALGDFIRRRFHVEVPAAAWPVQELPPHLQMRLAITAPDGRELAVGRDPGLLRVQTAAEAIPPEVRRQWERFRLTGWDFEDLPEVLASSAGACRAWVAYPALESGPEGVSLKLFSRRDHAQAAHRKGVSALLAVHCGRDLKYLKRSLALPAELHAAARHFGGARRVEDAMVERVVNDLFAADIRTKKAFEDHATACGRRLVPAATGLAMAVAPVLAAYAQVRSSLASFCVSAGPLAEFREAMEKELSRLVPPNFIQLYDPGRLASIERYLQARILRIRRAGMDLEKDRAKAAAVEPYSRQLSRLLQSLAPTSTAAKCRAVEELFWMIEEYKVSVFAQELKTARPVSPKRLAQKIAEIESMT